MRCFHIKKNEYLKSESKEWFGIHKSAFASERRRGPLFMRGERRECFESGKERVRSNQGEREYNRIGECVIDSEKERARLK